MLMNITLQPAGENTYHVYRGSIRLSKRPARLHNAERRAAYERQYSYRIFHQRSEGLYYCMFAHETDSIWAWFHCSKNEKYEDAAYSHLRDAQAYFARYDIVDIEYETL